MLAWKGAGRACRSAVRAVMVLAGDRADHIGACNRRDGLAGHRQTCPDRCKVPQVLATMLRTLDNMRQHLA
jgi:hypothetical protein